jgi:hypothetical protein
MTLYENVISGVGVPITFVVCVLEAIQRLGHSHMFEHCEMKRLLRNQIINVHVNDLDDWGANLTLHNAAFPTSGLAQAPLRRLLVASFSAALPSARHCFCTSARCHCVARALHHSILIPSPPVLGAPWTVRATGSPRTAYAGVACTSTFAENPERVGRHVKH